MKQFIQLLCLVFLSLSLIGQQRELDTSLEVGTLPGHFGVSLSGEATYSIPIDLPPGLAGLTPELGFVYNSNNANGIMGKGWSIGGLSSVTRVPATYYLNDYPSPVNFADDQLSLGGKKIIKVNQNNNEYRFENDNMTKILKQYMKNTKSDGVKYVVYSKFGLITTYGGTDESHLCYHIDTNPALMYYLSKIEDKHGNIIEYSYDRNIDEGSIYLSKIEYTVRNDKSLTIQAPEFKVKFIYEELETKNIKTVHFSTGAFSRDPYKFTIGKRLKEVQIYHNFLLISKYEITYKNGGELDQYFVDRISLSKGGKYINSTCFDWIYDIDVSNNTIVSETWSDAPENFPQQIIQTADYNNNGLIDIVLLNTLDRQTTISLHMNNNGGESFELNDISQIGQIKTSNSLISQDFNGDGTSELMVQTFAHGIFLYEIVKNNVSNKYELINRPHPIEVNTIPDKQNLYSGDFNGDGLKDCITESEDGLLEYYSGSVTNFLQSTNIEKQLSSVNGDLYVGDFDGEGKSEILFWDKENEQAKVIELNTKNTELIEHTVNIYYPNSKEGNKLRSKMFSDENIQLVLSDLNTDGKTDILISDKEKNEITFFFSFGYDLEFQQTLHDIEHDNISTADVNGDGREDLISYQKNLNYHSKGYLETRLLNIDGLTLERPVSLPIDGQSSSIFLLGHYKFGDFTGTAKQDLVCSYIHSMYQEDWSQIVDVVYSGKKSINRINRITDGFGKTTKIEYEYLPVFENYQTSEIEMSQPLKITTPRWLVVSKVENDNGIGDFFSPSTYEYHNLMYHRLGKKYIGFEKMIVKNGKANSYLLNQFKIYGAEIGKYYMLYNSLTEKYSLNGTEKGQRISSSKNEIDHINWYDDDRVFFHYIKKNTYSEFDFATGNNYKVNYLEKDNFDEYGNCKKLTITKHILFDKTHQTTIEQEFKNFINNGLWIIGKPLETTITKKYLGQTSVTESINHTIYTYYENTYDNGFGMPKTEIFQIDDPNAIQKTFTYDNYGNMQTISIDSYHNPSDNSKRTTELIYGPETLHRFATKVVNPLKQTTNLSYYQSWGWQKELTDPNGLNIQSTYNSFGFLRDISFPDGTKTISDIKWVIDNTDSPENALYYVETKKNDNPPSQTYYDKLNRELRTVSIGFNGEKIYSDKGYNSDDGKLSSTTKPYFTDDTKYSTKFTYDEIKRLDKVELPGSRVFNYIYTMNIAGFINPLKQTKYALKGSLGKPIYINENNEAAIIRNYDTEGRIIETKLENQDNTKISYKFDIFGNIIEVNDPAIGKKEFNYNCFGELTKVFHNEILEQENLEYDKLGRLTAMNEPNHGQTTYLFDEQFIGLLDEINFTSSSNASLFKQTFGYDEFARNNTITESISQGNINEQFVISLTYDDYSRTKSLSYPSGYVINHNYNQYGYLDKILQELDNSILWENKKMNASHQFLEYKYGNGIATFNSYIPATGYLWKSNALNIEKSIFVNQKDYKLDAIGNLSNHAEYSESGEYKMEIFQYDNLNRLNKTELYYHGNYGNSVELEYDQLGRIIYKKSDNKDFHVANKYTYDDNGPNPYKLLEIDGVPAFYNADQQTIKYTPFDKVENIRQHNSSHQLINELDIYYAYGHQRKIQTTFNYENYKKTTKIYVGNLFEKLITEDIAKNSNVQTEEVHYINAPTGLTAIYTKTDGLKTSMNYVHKNHLGSITELSGTDAQVIEKFSFDSWGRRRNPDSWIPWTEATETTTDKGFSGHEQLDNFALINMNGRIYDPVVGLFTTPDPMLGIPTNTQAFNNYSYVYNNPLKYTDPSGFRAEEIADIGAGPLWYQLFGSGMDFSGNILNTNRFFSVDFSGNFEESTAFTPGDDDRKTKKKSSSARKPKPVDNRSKGGKKPSKNNYINHLSPISSSIRSTPFDNEKVLNDLSDYNDGTEPNNGMGRANQQTEGGCDNCISKEIFANFIKDGAEYTSHDKFIEEGNDLMKRGYGGVISGALSGILTGALSYTRYAKYSSPLGMYLTTVSALVGIDQISRSNGFATIHNNYDISNGLGVFSIIDEGLNHLSIKYYDAKSGDYLGSVSFPKSRNR